MRIWAKIWQDNHMLRDTVYEDTAEDTRTHKIFRGIEAICHEFDLGIPIWLESNIAEFKRHSRTKFHQDSFIEEIEFDALEIQIIEEDSVL